MAFRRRFGGALILILLGVFFLLINFNVIPWDLKKLWPVILIVLGVADLFGN